MLVVCRKVLFSNTSTDGDSSGEKIDNVPAKVLPVDLFVHLVDQGRGILCSQDNFFVLLSTTEV